MNVGGPSERGAPYLYFLPWGLRQQFPPKCWYSLPDYFHYRKNPKSKDRNRNHIKQISKCETQCQSTCPQNVKKQNSETVKQLRTAWIKELEKTFEGVTVQVEPERLYKWSSHRILDDEDDERVHCDITVFRVCLQEIWFFNIITATTGFQRRTLL
jgi:hypothetical protein